MPATTTATTRIVHLTAAPGYNRTACGIDMTREPYGAAAADRRLVTCRECLMTATQRIEASRHCDTCGHSEDQHEAGMAWCHVDNCQCAIFIPDGKSATQRIEAASSRNAQRLNAEGNEEVRRRIAAECRMLHRAMLNCRGYTPEVTDGGKRALRQAIKALTALGRYTFAKGEGC